MIFDPDHMSVIGRQQALNLVESLDYSGIVSSHSWSTDDALPRIYALGGMSMPYAGGSTGFIEQWRHLRAYYRQGGHPVLRGRLRRRHERLRRPRACRAAPTCPTR